MQKMIANLGQIALISLGIYLAIALILIATDRPVDPVVEDEPVSMNALMDASYTELPPLQTYTGQDGAALAYRFYASRQPSDKLLFLLHGSGWHSMQFHPLAHAISRSGVAHVVTPDLRGHGFTPARRGDVDYIGQLEDDLAALIRTVQQDYPGAQVIVGGHSSGGGLAVRFAGGSHGALADAYLLLAPFLKYNAPTTRPNSGGWAQPNARRIAGLSMLNRLGISWLNGLTVIRFAMPQAVLDSTLGHTATTAYSYRLNTSYAPRDNYTGDLAAMRQPFLLAVGEADESFVAEAYEPLISAHTDSGVYALLPDTGHIDLLTNPQLAPLLEVWLADDFVQESTK